jgi:hypothetical protein
VNRASGGGGGSIGSASTVRLGGGVLAGTRKDIGMIRTNKGARASATDGIAPDGALAGDRAVARGLRMRHRGEQERLERVLAIGAFNGNTLADVSLAAPVRAAVRTGGLAHALDVATNRSVPTNLDTPEVLPAGPHALAPVVTATGGQRMLDAALDRHRPFHTPPGPMERRRDAGPAGVPADPWLRFGGALSAGAGARERTGILLAGVNQLNRSRALQVARDQFALSAPRAAPLAGGGASPVAAAVERALARVTRFSQSMV